MKCIRGSKWKYLARIAALLAACTPAGATVLLEDAFEYPDGDVVGVAGSPWTAHSGAGNGPVTLQQGQLILSADGAEDISALLAGAPHATDGSAGPLYAGFILEVTGLPSTDGSYWAHFRNTASSHRGRLWISQTGAAEGRYRLGIGNSVGADATTGPWDEDLELGVSYRVVVRYVPETGISTLWVNPGSEADSGSTATDSPGITAISNFSFRQNGDIGQLRVDDLVVADTFAEVADDGMRLAIRREGGEVVVTWPVSEEVWGLEWTTNLQDWFAYEEAPVQEGPAFEVRPDGGMPGVYYRLVQP